MIVDQVANAAAVGGDEAVEAPFFAQDVAQQLVVDVHRDAVNFVVRGHDGLHVRLSDGGFKGL
jgi:hypothetical protein